MIYNSVSVCVCVCVCVCVHAHRFVTHLSPGETKVTKGWSMKVNNFCT